MIRPGHAGAEDWRRQFITEAIHMTASWHSVKRTFLYGLGTFLLVGVFGLLAISTAEAVVLALSLLPVCAIAFAAAGRAHHGRSQSQAILGWLLGLLAMGGAGGVVVVVLNFAALLRRSGFVDVWTPIQVLCIVLLLLIVLLYVEKSRPHFARRASKEARRRDYRLEANAYWRREPKRRRKWWDVLEIDPKASADEIRHAYLRKLQMYHPDRLAGLAPELVKISESRTLEINLAFEQAKRAAANDRS